MQDKYQKQAQAILDGKEPAPNEFVQYLLEQVTAMRGELRMTLEQADQTRMHLQKLERTAIGIEGAHNKALSDMMTWLAKLDDKTAPTAETPTAATPN